MHIYTPSKCIESMKIKSRRACARQKVRCDPVFSSRCRLSSTHWRSWLFKTFVFSLYLPNHVLSFIYRSCPDSLRTDLPVSLAFILSCEIHILQALYCHYVSQKFQLCFPDVIFKCLFFYIFFHSSLILICLSMIFSSTPCIFLFLFPCEQIVNIRSKITQKKK